MADVRVTGLTELRAKFRQFSDRRFAAAVATGLTRVGQQAKQGLKDEMGRSLDRPTPYALNSLYLTPATAERQVARVWFKDDTATSNAGTPATRFMVPQVYGGPRRLKRYEHALQIAGALPSGWFTVAGQGAKLDGFGNVSKGQIVQILSQLRITLVAGSNRNLSTDGRKQANALKRAGGRFFVVPPGARIQPGIYQREFIGRTITPVLIFVRSVAYQPRFDFPRVSTEIITRALPVELTRSLNEHIERLAARGRR